MDGEHLKNVEGYAKVCEMRDGALAELDRLTAETREQIEVLAETGNRKTRRKADIAREVLAEKDKAMRGKINRLFQKFTSRFDANAGTFIEVQEEAAAAFAEIFS